ncbi:MAG: CarD family transcriptional regulator [Clostridia bacterium]|nr:CarD family transcriptional regulator [Clostridia bacterium]
MNFNVGSYVVYPLHGAGTIDSIIEKESPDGDTVKYYNIRFPYGNLVLMVPVDSAENIGLRPVVPLSTIPEVFEHLRNTDLVPLETNWNKRQRENLERMKSGDIFVTADVYKYLLKRDNERALSSGEKKLLVSARRILFSEIHFVSGMAEDEIESAISSIIKSA